MRPHQHVPDGRACELNAGARALQPRLITLSMELHLRMLRRALAGPFANHCTAQKAVHLSKRLLQ